MTTSSLPFSVTKNSKPLDSSKYNWIESTKTFSSKERNLVIDASECYGITFITGSDCTLTTGSYCIFKTGYGCTLRTEYNCIFNTGYSCTFNTGPKCIFSTGCDCTFNTGYDCTFNTGSCCTFTCGENCFATRRDVKGVTEIPEGKTIKFNEFEIPGHEFV